MATSPNRVDDVRMHWPRSSLGPPIFFTNAEIRKMLQLAGAKQGDIFCDLGCGWGQNLLIAASEFNVKRCIGVELKRSRYLKAMARARRWGLSPHIKVIHGDLEDFILDDDSDIQEATIVYYGLSTSADLVDLLSAKLPRGCKLVYQYRALFPEITPDGVDFPFLVSVQPFTKPTSELGWLNAVIRKRRSAQVPGTPPTVEELWDELLHDYEVLGLRAEVRGYQARLRRTVGTQARLGPSGGGLQLGP